MHGGFVELGYFNKDLSKINGKEVTKGSILEFILLDTFKASFLMENLFLMETISRRSG